MSIETRCPNPKCNARFVVTEEQLGRNALCKKCGMRFKISQGLGIPLLGPPGRSPTRPESQQAAAAVTQPQEAVPQPVRPPSTEPAGPDAAVTQAETPAAQPSPAQAGMPELGVTQAVDGSAIGPQAQGEDAADRQAAEAAVPAEWDVGDVILDTYEVRKLSDSLDYAEGGFGRVYRVHHRGWNMDLAVKSPLADKFQNEQQKQNFIAECETWIDLGLHPNIVSCHYVRLLGGIPRVFAEFVEGGSLAHWIRDEPDGRPGRLYEGGTDKALERILDIAIQFAWGLHYAHEHDQNLVHQDVKPHNVMMTPDGVAKLADFGLARARAAAENEEGGGKRGQSIKVKGGRGMTPAYASPEQANGDPLTRKTDIWSWAVSVLDMFCGDVARGYGPEAMQLLDEYLAAGPPKEYLPNMPPAVAELLRQCLHEDPASRPTDMGQIVTALKSVYEKPKPDGGVGGPYPREEPKPAEMLADSLNNRAVSMTDLGRTEEAEELYGEALKVDPHHPEATYNRGLWMWRSARMTDQALVLRLREVRAARPADGRVLMLEGLIHLERGDAESAVKVLEDADAISGGDARVSSLLAFARERMGKWGRCLRAFGGGQQ